MECLQWFDYLTGRAVTATVHMVNQTIVDTYTKKQNTVETSTYGSEFVAARTATEQIIDLRLTLRYLGVPVYRSVMLATTNRLSPAARFPIHN